MKRKKETLILKGADYVTEITFYHIEEVHQKTVADTLASAFEALILADGFIAANVLLSTDETRICTYVQWKNEESLTAARAKITHYCTPNFKALLENESGLPRLYDVHYADDKSDTGVSIISPNYTGTMFINEITTIPGTKQLRLLELVVDNNVNQSFNTPGYRSANFHRSLDGYRAVNYSLWDSEEHLIEAISAMADEDVNLEETVQLANPDFRFYTLFYAKHI